MLVECVDIPLPPAMAFCYLANESSMGFKRNIMVNSTGGRNRYIILLLFNNQEGEPHTVFKL